MLISTPGAPRRASLTVLALAAMGAAAGCSGGAARVAPTPADDIRWTASLMPRTNPPLSGTVTIVPTEERDGWRATVIIQGRPSATGALGWRIYSGICGTSGTPIGSPVDFPAIQLHADGRASAETILDPDIFSGGVHSVRIYATPGGNGGVVACGELRT